MFHSVKETVLLLPDSTIVGWPDLPSHETRRRTKTWTESIRIRPEGSGHS